MINENGALAVRQNSNTMQNTKPTENYGDKPESLW